MKLEAELTSLKSSATRWNAEQMDAVRQLAVSLGWNDVENSKLLSVFLADFIDGLKANAVPNGKFPLSTFTWLDAACYETDAQGPYIKFAGKTWRPGSVEPAAMPVEKPTKINMEVGVVGREQPVCRDCDGNELKAGDVVECVDGHLNDLIVGDDYKIVRGLSGNCVVVDETGDMIWGCERFRCAETKAKV